MKIFVHIVTFNSEEVIGRCLESLVHQEGFSLGRDLLIEVTDNASKDRTLEVVGRFDGIAIHTNRENFGFCGAHNQGATRFLDSPADIYLVLNPDIELTPTTLKTFRDSFPFDTRIGSATGKLMRSSVKERGVIDSTGIIFTPSLRHFDRGEESLDRGQYEVVQEVAGGTGACLFLTKDFIRDVSFRAAYDEDVGKLYPQLLEGRDSRVQLFDEAFFAYREDADLAWRAWLLGWRCIYLPEVVAYHERQVTSTRRGELSPIINLLGVRNRFLLQLNNLHLLSDRRAFFAGFLVRNLIVIAGVVFRERSSIPAFRQIWILMRRALARRKVISKRRTHYTSIIGA